MSAARRPLGDAAGADADKDADAPPSPTEEYWNAITPRSSGGSGRASMRVRMRKQASEPKLTPLSSMAPNRIVSDVKKIIHFDKARDAFKTNVRLSMRIAMGVLLAGVAQTRASSTSGKQWYFLPASYYLGGLSWSAMMVIFAASRNVGGAIQQIWQIDLGVAIALVFNFVVFYLIPMNQEDLITVPVNFSGREYYVSLQDWGRIVPLILAFTFVLFVSPLEQNVKKFAVSTNLYFMLSIVSPMNPAIPTQRKDLGRGTFSVTNLMNNLAVYSVVGVIGTFISLATMLFPYPIFAIRQLRTHIREAPADIRAILNLIVDAYCLRARDIREMDFFRLKLERLMKAAQARLTEMEALLADAWWEEIAGGGWYFGFNKTVVKQFVRLYAKLLKDLHAMKFAIELETCHWTHTQLMAHLQRNIYLLQVETNDLLDEVAAKVLVAATEMPVPSFNHLERQLAKLMKKYTRLYGELLAKDVRRAEEVGSSMPLNLFLYSLHTLVQTLFEFEQDFNRKDFSTPHRMKGFVRRVWRSFWRKDAYSKSIVIFSLRTSLGVFIGICLSTFVFAFSSTVPNAIAMVAQFYMGGTYGNTVNRLSGLVAGTVLPSVFSFFICKSGSNVVYNTLNNAALLVWTMLSMYVFYSGSYIKSAGMVSAYMAASVLLEHSCRAQNGFKALSYSSLTENSLGILILLLLELLLQSRSARTLLRASLRDFLRDYGACLARVYRHHIAMERGDSGSDGLLDADAVKTLRKQLEGSFSTQLDEQRKLLRDAALEPDLWRPLFSPDKFRTALDVCDNLLAHLRILLDLVDWHARRRNSGVDLPLQQRKTNGEGDSGNVEVAAIRAAQRAWHRAQDEYAGAVSEALDTLVLLLGENFAQANADENAVFMQMKEAFRLADVDRNGEVDPQELATLLDKLLPYAARSGDGGDVGMDQYVAEFMRLVDRNRDGKISYAEFLDALNHGFRLELEVYERARGTSTSAKANVSMGVGMTIDYARQDLLLPLDSGDATHDEDDDGDASRVDVDVDEADDSALSTSYSASGNSSAPVTTSDRHAATGASGMLSRLWDAPWTFGWPSSRATPGSQAHKTTSPKPMPVAPTQRMTMDAGVLLNVESFSIKDAAARLRTTYGEHLLLQTAERHVAVEDFILMSCLICATDEIAARLTTLNSLVAS